MLCIIAMCVRYPGESEQLLCQTLFTPAFLANSINAFSAINSFLLQELIKRSTDIVYVSYEFV